MKDLFLIGLFIIGFCVLPLLMELALDTIESIGLPRQPFAVIAMISVLAFCWYMAYTGSRGKEVDGPDNDHDGQ